MGRNVGIVVVTYNRLQLLTEVIDALRKQSYNDYQIVVVNNGSTDGTEKWLSQQRDIITITQENLGGAGGFFTGMKYVAEHGYEYCWIMDDDVLCMEDSLFQLLSVYDKDIKAGFVCSKVIGEDGSSMNVPIVDLREDSNGYPQWYDKSDLGLIRVKKATFVSVLFPCSIIKDFGLPYKEYFIWGDDWEYTQRISEKMTCYMSIRSKVIHRRKIQKRIIFEQEKDIVRINNYYYAFRNNNYNSVKYKEKSKVYVICSLLFHAFKSAVNMKFLHSKIYFKSLKAFLVFAPRIEYPSDK